MGRSSIKTSAVDRCSLGGGGMRSMPLVDHHTSLLQIASGPYQYRLVTVSDCHEIDMWSKEAFDMIARFVGLRRAMYGLAQRGAARQADNEMANELFELIERQPIAKLKTAHLEISQQQLALIGRRRLKRLLAAAQLGDLHENPWVSHRAAPDHHAIGAAFVQAPQRVGRVAHIARANHRNADSALDFG